MGSKFNKTYISLALGFIMIISIYINNNSKLINAIVFLPWVALLIISELPKSFIEKYVNNSVKEKILIGLYSIFMISFTGSFIL